MSAAAADLAQTRRASDAARLATPAILGAIFIASIAAHVTLGTVGDVSWLITVDEKWLAGATPYRDVLEINPPASLLLYWPAVALAKALHVGPEFMVAAFGYALAGLGLTLAGRIARIDARGAILPAVALAAALLMPGHSFDERDTLAAFAALPFLALIAARIEGRGASLPIALLCGALMGACVAIKPPYALIPLCLLPWFVWRLKSGALRAWPEALATATVALAYAGIVVLAFPSYMHDALPIGVAIYAPIRESLSRLATNAEVFPAGLMLVSYLARRRSSGALAQALALGAFGAFLAFIAQGKGWAYQAFPLEFTAALLGAVGLQAGAPSPRSALALAGLAAAMATLAIVSGQAPTPLAALAALIWPILGARLGAREGAASLFGVALPISANALFAAAFGAACGVYAVEGVQDSHLEAALARVAPHPRVLAISESLGFGHPLVRDVGGEWVGGAPSQWITVGARALIKASGDDPATVARLTPFIDADRDRLVADITREKPDAILVGELGTPFHDWAWSDPAITAARADYVFFAGNDDKDWPAEIWVRRDLLGLRAGPSAP